MERTLLDGLDRPHLCGGVKEVVRAIWTKQKQIDWRKLAQYAANFHSKAAVKRLGFILEILGVGNDCVVLLLRSIIAAKDYIYLDPDGSKSGAYVSRWRVRLNMSVEELKEGRWG